MFDINLVIAVFLPGNEYFLRARKYDRRIDHSEIYHGISSFSFDMQVTFARIFF